jgi:tetratricopeptide (TPR) repeat protein
VLLWVPLVVIGEIFSLFFSLERKKETETARCGGGEKKMAASSRARQTRQTPRAIFEKGMEYATTCQFEMAEKFFRRVIELDANFTPALDELALVLLELGDPEQAVSLLRRSIQTHPQGNLRIGDQGYLKYLTLAQLIEGRGALTCYTKGAELLQQLQQSCDDAEERDFLSKKTAEAYASAAELYLTDLCMEADAEESCESLLQKALDIDPNNTDALQTAASCRLSQARNEDALEMITKSYDTWKSLDPHHDELPSYGFRISTAKLFIELQSYPEAIAILDQLLLEDEDVTEVWYLLALAHQMAEDFDNCAETVANALQHVKTCDEMSKDDRQKWLTTFDDLTNCLAEKGVALPQLEVDDDVHHDDNDDDDNDDWDAQKLCDDDVM